VHVETGPLSQPGANLGVLVGAVVIHNQVHIKVGWNRLLDLAQKAQKFLVAMAWLALGDHLPGGHVRGGKQGGGAVADVVMRHPLHVTQTHG